MATLRATGSPRDNHNNQAGNPTVRPSSQGNLTVRPSNNPGSPMAANSNPVSPTVPSRPNTAFHQGNQATCHQADSPTGSLPTVHPAASCLRLVGLCPVATDSLPAATHPRSKVIHLRRTAPLQLGLALLPGTRR